MAHCTPVHGKLCEAVGVLGPCSGCPGPPVSQKEAADSHRLPAEGLALWPPGPGRRLGSDSCGDAVSSALTEGQASGMRLAVGTWVRSPGLCAPSDGPCP